MVQKKTFDFSDSSFVLYTPVECILWCKRTFDFPLFCIHLWNVYVFWGLCEHYPISFSFDADDRQMEIVAWGQRRRQHNYLWSPDTWSRHDYAKCESEFIMSRRYFLTIVSNEWYSIYTHAYTSWQERRLCTILEKPWSQYVVLFFWFPTFTMRYSSLICCRYRLRTLVLRSHQVKLWTYRTPPLPCPKMGRKVFF